MGRRVIKLVLGGLPTRSRTRRAQVGEQMHDEVGPGPGGVGDGGVLLIHRSDPAVGLCHRVAEQLAAPNQPALPHSGIDGENQTSSRQSRTAPHP